MLSAREAPELGLTWRKGSEAGRAAGHNGLVSASGEPAPERTSGGGCAPGRSCLPVLPVLVGWSLFLPRLSQWPRENVVDHVAWKPQPAPTFNCHCPGERGTGAGVIGEFGMDPYTSLEFKMGN